MADVGQEVGLGAAGCLGRVARLRQHLLDPLALADVGRDAAQGIDAAVDIAQRQLDRGQRDTAAARLAQPFALDTLAVQEDALVGLARELGTFGAEQLDIIASDDVAALPCHLLGSLAIDVAVAVVGALDEDRGIHAVQDGVEPVLALLQGLLLFEVAAVIVLEQAAQPAREPPGAAHGQQQQGLLPPHQLLALELLPDGGGEFIVEHGDGQYPAPGLIGAHQRGLAPECPRLGIWPVIAQEATALLRQLGDMRHHVRLALGQAEIVHAFELWGSGQQDGGALQAGDADMAGATEAGGAQPVQRLAALMLFPVVQIVAHPDQPVAGGEVAYVGQLVGHPARVLGRIPAVTRPALAARLARRLDQAGHDGATGVVALARAELALELGIGRQQPDMALHVVDEDIAPPAEESDRPQGFQDQAPDLGRGATAGLAFIDALRHAMGRVDLVDQTARQDGLGACAAEVDHAQHAGHLALEPGLDLLLGRGLDVAQCRAVGAPALPGEQAGEQEDQQEQDRQRTSQVQARQIVFVRKQFHSSSDSAAPLQAATAGPA